MNYKNLQLYLFFFLFILAGSKNVFAKEYSIFSPIPKEKMRPMSTARPSKSDYSYTIDSGHIQIETSLYSFDKTKTTSSRTTNHSLLNSTAFRIGLSQSTEAELITTPIIWRKEKALQNNATTHKNGFSDTTIRLKHNFLGNDSGNFSIAAIPFFKIPTNSNNLSNNYNEGGISIPIDIPLEHGYSLTYNPQALHLKRSDNLKYKTVFTNIFVISKSLTDKFSTYVEYYHSQVPESSTRFQQTLDFGVVYQLSKNLTIDGAINFGLSNNSTDLELLFGGAYRF